MRERERRERREREKRELLGWVIELWWLSKKARLLEENEEERKDEEARILLKQIHFSYFEERKPRIKYDTEHQ